jgi:glucosamine-6-phosphate deaminase
MKSNLENKPDISYESPGKFEDTRFEKIHNVLFKTRQKPLLLLLEIADLIKAKQKKENCVLGLATGSSPIMVYEELVRMHREEGLSFSNHF